MANFLLTAKGHRYGVLYDLAPAMAGLGVHLVRFPWLNRDHPKPTSRSTTGNALQTDGF